MVPLLSLARKPQYQRIERAKRKALEPRDFCNIWIEKLYGIKPDERGFKAACIKELAKITGTRYATIERNWGADFSDRPSWVPRLLRREHMLNRIREVVNLSPEDLDDLDLDT
jgi:hypothetical protein